MNIKERSLALQMAAPHQGLTGLKAVTVLAVLLGLAVFTSPVLAVPVYTLTDLNSQAQFDLGSQAGCFSWRVDGVERITQQWFWYRVGSTGPEHSIDTLPLLNSKVLDANFEPGLDTLVAKYGGTGFQLDALYTLTGGTAGSHRSDIIETIRITNTGTSPLDFHFFQYSDFSLTEQNGAGVEMLDIEGVLATVTGDSIVSETTAIQPPSHFEGGTYPATLVKLNDSLPTTLSDTGAMLSGNVTWAFEWDAIINPGGSFLISKDKLIRPGGEQPIPPIPEPVTLAGVLMGAAGLSRYICKRRQVRP